MDLYNRLSPSNLFSSNEASVSIGDKNNLLKMLELRSDSADQELSDYGMESNTFSQVPASLEKKSQGEKGKPLRSDRDLKSQQKADRAKKVQEYVQGSARKGEVPVVGVHMHGEQRKLSDNNNLGQDQSKQINYVVRSQQKYYRQSVEPDQQRKGKKLDKDKTQLLTSRLNSDRSVTKMGSNKKDPNLEFNLNKSGLAKNFTNTSSQSNLLSAKKPPSNFQLKNCADKLGFPSNAHQAALIGHQNPSIAKNKSQSRQITQAIVATAGSLLESEKKGKKPLIAKKASDYLYPPKEPGNVDPDLKDIQFFVEKWGLQVKYKNAYTRNEVAQLLKQVDEKVSQLDQVTSYERKKAEEYKEESKLLSEQVGRQKEEIESMKGQLSQLLKNFGKESDLVQKLEECQVALKETLLNSLICIDFYKDLESHIQQSKYEEQEDEVMKHLDIIEALTKQHGLDSMDFESEKTQELIDSIGELIRFKEVNEKHLDVALKLDEDKQISLEDDDEDQNTNLDSSRMRVKVTKLKKDLTQLELSKGVGVRTPSTYRGDLNSSTVAPSSVMIPRIPNRHIMCCHGTHEEMGQKYELQQKNKMIGQLQEKLEGKVKRILELKAELQRERDEESKKRRYAQFKETITRLEKEYNQQVIKNTRQELHIKTLKEETENQQQQIITLRDHLRQSQSETEEFRKILKEKDGFKQLESTVVELSNLIVSKKNQHLSTSQKMQLKAVFGNSAILHQLRRRLQDLEGHYSKQGVLLTQSVNISIEFQSVIEEIWRQLKMAREAFLHVEEKDLGHYQLIVLSNSVKQRWTEGEVKKLELELDEKGELMKEIRQQLSKDTFVEKMSRELAADKDKLALMKMMIQDTAKTGKARGTEISMFTPNKEAVDHSVKHKNYSERPSVKFKQLTKVSSEKNFGFQNRLLMNESIPEFAENQIEKIDEKLKQLFDASKDTQQPSGNSLIAQSTRDLKKDRAARYQSQDSTPVLQIYGGGGQVNFDSASMTLHDSCSQVCFPMSGGGGVQMSNLQAARDQSLLQLKAREKGASRLDSTTLLNELDSQNQSVVRANGKKLLRQKIKRYKQEILNLKLTLKVMQEKVDRAGELSTANFDSVQKRPGEVEVAQALAIIAMQAQTIESQLAGLADTQQM